MTTIEKFVDVPAPAQVAYAHWAAMEAFPAFMHNVSRVQRTGADTVHWEAQVGTAHREWDARITQREPGHLISWESTSGARNAGTVTFKDIDDGACRVKLRLEFEPGNWVDQLGDVLGFVASSVEGDLERFAQHVERMPLLPMAQWPDPSTPPAAEPDPAPAPEVGRERAPALVPA